MNHIKILNNKKGDDFCHNKFIRFGLGDFEREKMIIRFGSTIQIQAGFEFVDVFYKFIADLISANNLDDKFELKGLIISSEEVESKVKKLGLEVKKKVGKKYTIEGVVNSTKFIEFANEFAGNFLISVNVKSKMFQISTKGNPPKPGSLKEKFVVFKLDSKFAKEVQEEFLFDINTNDIKSAEISQIYSIEEIKIPKEFEKDAAKARLNAIRKGKIKRNVVIIGKKGTENIEKVISFEI